MCVCGPVQDKWSILAPGSEFAGGCECWEWSLDPQGKQQAQPGHILGPQHKHF